MTHFTRPNEVGDVRLTHQQYRVLLGICAGKTNREIGEHLGVGEKTVKAHVTALMKRLGVSNRTQAMLAAGRAGINSRELMSFDVLRRIAMDSDESKASPSVLTGHRIHEALDWLEAQEEHPATMNAKDAAIVALSAVRKIQFAVALFGHLPTQDVIPVIRKLVS